MATQGIVRSASTRNVKKLEKPRPLKQSLSVDSLMLLVETLTQSISISSYDENFKTNISTLNNLLKAKGNQLESVYKDQLDRAFVLFRNATRDDQLDFESRRCVLELIELRASGWQGSDALQNYYNSKMQSDFELLASRDQRVTPSLAPGDILKNSGKFLKPTKIPGKNYCKDELVIRNSDSGKVMGIKGRRVHMIEELSETIISFQRVNPGKKERLVQIIGPNEEKILHARHLIEDTIRNNASPVRDSCEREKMGGSTSSLNSSASDESNRIPFTVRGSRALLHSLSTPDASIGEYKYSVTVGNDTIKITGTNHELVRNAKLVLDEYFSRENFQNYTPDCYTHYEEDVFVNNNNNIGNYPVYKRLGMMEPSNGGGTVPPIPPIPPIPSLSSSGESDDTTCISTVAGDFVTYMGPETAPVSSFTHPVVTRRVSETLTEKTDSAKKRYKYSVEFLMSLLDLPASSKPPKDWDRISKEHPAIVKQDDSHFDSESFLQKRRVVKERSLAPIVIDSSPDSE
ncbi:eukaryotic translation initiation factor 4E-binding protein Mextli isoform X3 [Nilaparvata lugens]|uniref:eukaryotic translation initiation factor 4E-binding protein Mextli isoform X3 n=1 Tax=Nilaparvata lugens TaxID=108931 RepID=UPI00193D2058|nr:eukaryotic translation initiation factor 4E-binding protein Mextli isoform X3 [Nilaparvata lugens]